MAQTHQIRLLHESAKKVYMLDNILIISKFSLIQFLFFVKLFFVQIGK